METLCFGVGRYIALVKTGHLSFARKCRLHATFANVATSVALGMSSRNLLGKLIATVADKLYT